MHVTLRAVADDDAGAIFAMMRDPEAVRMAAFTAADPGDRDAFDAHLSRLRSSASVSIRTVEADGAFAGTVAAFTLGGEREVTYWIRRELWNRGIATAALRLLVAAEPVRPLHARVAADNIGSRRVLDRAGFVETGREVSYPPRAGAPVEELVLRLG
jgi:RimJ/RimL family protein N-acetyltransferase